MYNYLKLIILSISFDFHDITFKWSDAFFELEAVLKVSIFNFWRKTDGAQTIKNFAIAGSSLVVGLLQFKRCCHNMEELFSEIS